MAEGFVQVSPDSTGKQIDNDVITIPAGTIVTDGSGVQTTLSAPAYYFRQRVVNADPTNPLGIASVTNADGPNPRDYGLSVRMPMGQADLQTIAALLLDIDTNIAAIAGTQPLGAIGLAPQPQYALPIIGGLGPAIVSPTVPRSVVSDAFGRQVVLPHTIRELAASQLTTVTAASPDTTIITAGPADTYNDVVAIILSNTSATAVRIDISDQNDAVNKILLSIYLPAGDVRGVSLGGVIIPQTLPGLAWSVRLSAGVTDVRAWALYIKNKTR